MADTPNDAAKRYHLNSSKIESEPIIEPTLRTGIEAMLTAAGAWLCHCGTGDVSQ
jgi:hypothetical protein